MVMPAKLEVTCSKAQESKQKGITFESKAMPAQYGQIDLPAELNLGKPSPIDRQNMSTTKAPIIILPAAT